ncbi:MAG: Stk1 family PASTA domain-containing Ser/Thr kinase [Erysipelotrichaceae bacterium]|nr:Stk1 family PASTA domain-containing Ser/Thr kinase [Erysipelotrichaceae bacterium]
MIIANRYEVIKEIGRGGMANVYLALDKILNREVAIKVLKGDMSSDPISLERFNREANTSTKLSHPNAVDIYDVGQDGNYHYIVMEYVKGHTLKQLLSRRGPFPYKEAIWIMKQLCAALLEAHRNGIIHRDIKSQNVLIKDDGTVKLADFGIAILNNAMQLTSRGSVLGSVHYLAPELSKGGQATMQSDIYSLGIVLFELLSGDVPFKADQAVQVAIMHVRNEIPSICKINRDIPQSIENIIIKATAKNLDERYANIALMLRDLNRCLIPEVKNEPKVVLKGISTKQPSEPIKVANKAEIALKKKKEKRKERIISGILITAVTLVSALAIVMILFITGIIGGKEDPYVTVPELKGYSVTVAKDIVAPLGLKIDDSSIEWILTDDIAANIIVSYTPGYGTKVEKGSKINLIVSEGTYSIMHDYIGMHIEEAKGILSTKGFQIISEAVESDKTPGTIISQELIVAGDKYDPNIINKVKFTYSASNTVMLPFDLMGKDINVVAQTLNDMGIPNRMERLSYNELRESEKKYSDNSLVRMSPNEGSLYEVDENSPVIIYYYVYE